MASKAYRWWVEFELCITIKIYKRKTTSGSADHG